MFELIKNIFSTGKGSRRIVIVDDDATRPSDSYTLHPVALWFFCIGAVVALAILFVVLFRYTPLGRMVYDQEELRNSVIAIQQKVAALQDTLEARNMQLNEMQKIILSGEDTTFGLTSSGAIDTGQAPARASDTYDVQRLPADAALIFNLFAEAPQFPAPFPLQGTLTRKFNMDTGHYGLDIAAPSGATFQAVAGGVLVSQGWTFNYGFVIVIQHPDGVMSIYKHAQSVNKSIGEVVRQGDILGEIGNVGILSSGPHLHIEIWDEGIAQNPQSYLIQP